MENINMTHVFRHPKFYRIPRDKSDQVISDEASTEATSVHPGPGQSTKPQAPSVKLSNQPVQASSDKHQAPSSKLQAPSHKQQAQ
jgi:hypothetical protein